LREALPLPCPYRYILFDRDRKFGGEVREFLKASGIKAVRTSVRSPWQNGVAERWVGGCRREMLDHIIPLSERHLLRLGHEYIRYYHEDRTHIGLQGDAGWPLDRVAAISVEQGEGRAANRWAAAPVHLVSGSVTDRSRRWRSSFNTCLLCGRCSEASARARIDLLNPTLVFCPSNFAGA
jgi:hypothetical protein